MTSPPTHRFRLFVAGGTENSAQAAANLTAICRAHLGDDFDIEIVDVFEQPTYALEHQILMTPTLLRLFPVPHRKIVGTLSNTQLVVRTLGLDAGDA